MVDYVLLTRADALAHTLAVMAEAADFFGDLQLWKLVALQLFDLQTP